MRAAATLLVLPDHTGVAQHGLTRARIEGLLRPLTSIRLGGDRGARVHLEGKGHDGIVELVGAVRGPLALVRTRRAHDEQDDHDRSRYLWTRRIERLTLPAIDEPGELIRHVDVLCWLLASLHRDDTDREGERLQLPASVTGLVRLLAALVARGAGSGAFPMDVVERWFPAEPGAKKDAPVGTRWPELELQPFGQERLGRGRTPRPSWPVVRASLLHVLARAVRDRQRCSIEYASLSAGGRTEVTLDPWYLVLRRGTWYLIAANLEDVLRVYRLERIMAVAPDAPGTRTSTPDIDRARRALRFDEPTGEVARVVRRVAAAPPPPGVDITEEPRQFPVEHQVLDRSYGLADWVFDNPMHAQVVAPEARRCAIADEAQRIIERHRGAASSAPGATTPPNRPVLRGVEAERQFAAIWTVLTWIGLRSRYNTDALNGLTTRLLGSEPTPEGPVELLDALHETLDPDARGLTPVEVPIMALWADERLAIAAVLNRVNRLPLPDDLRERVHETTAWMRCLLRSEELLLEPTSPPEPVAQTVGPVVISQQLARQCAILCYRSRDGRVTQRTVSPWWLVAGPRHTYLRALDHGSGAARWFRFDRILEAAPSSAQDYRPPTEPQPTRAPADAGQDGVTYTLRLDPGAWWLLDEIAPSSWPEDASGGAVTVEVTSTAAAYVHRLVLRGRGHAELLEPGSDRAVVAELAEQVLQLHRCP